MEIDDLMARAQRLEIRSRFLARSRYAGLYRSAFRGQGVEFAEVREYSEGDDIRLIDWNVSARSQSLYVKRMEEERERNVLLALDTSASLDFGSVARTKFSLLVEVGALLALSGSCAKDRISLALLRDRVERYIAPAKGPNHAARLVREMLACISEGRGSSMELAWSFLNSPGVPRSLVFLLTDFQCPISAGAGFASACRKHEMVAVLASDPREWSLPDVGRLRIRDPESGEARTVDTHDRGLRRGYEQNALERREAVLGVLRGYGADWVELSTSGEYEPALRRFFEARTIRKGDRRP
jgi:uncharacterized protein (DUF58 family)